MKKKWKRILTIVMIFVMLAGVLPVYAENGENQAADSGQSFWLQEYDLNSGQETDKAWYPDESGLIEVPLLEQPSSELYGIRHSSEGRGWTG